MNTVPKGTFVGVGRNRAVYAHGHFVVKIPLNDEGLDDNVREARFSRRYGGRPDPDGVLYARCRVLSNGWLVMQWVDTTYLPKEDRPDWSDWIDCHQVGRTRDGTIVAYDFGF